MSPRLTRQQKQQHTRKCLLESAAKVFTRRGMQQGSVDEVAEEAGFTKGAFYANFKSKEELFLAMLDQRFAQKLAELDEVMHVDESPEQQARRAGLESGAMAADDPEWQRLFFEFSAYAARNEEFREELVTRYRALRGKVARMFDERAAELGIDPPVPSERVSMMTFAMAHGAALEKLLEPDAVPDDLLGDMFELLFAGLMARVQPRDEEGAAAEPAGAA